MQALKVFHDGIVYDLGRRRGGGHIIVELHIATDSGVSLNARPGIVIALEISDDHAVGPPPTSVL